MNPRFIEIKKQIGKFIANFSVTEENGKSYIFDGEIIREGLDISTYDDNGDVIPLPDGEYTIKGTVVKVADGKVCELPEKNSREAEAPANENPTDEPKTEGIARNEEKDGGSEQPEANAQPTPNVESQDAEKDAIISDLRAENDRLKAENEAMKAELKELKETPMASPVPQRTDMASDESDDVPENIRGTKFERAYKIFKA